MMMFLVLFMLLMLLMLRLIIMVAVGKIIFMFNSPVTPYGAASAGYNATHERHYQACYQCEYLSASHK